MSLQSGDLNAAVSKLLRSFIFPKTPYYESLAELPQETRDTWVKLMAVTSGKAAFVKEVNTAHVLFDYIKWLVIEHGTDTISFTERELKAYILYLILSNIQYSVQQPNHNGTVVKKQQVDTLFDELALISIELAGYDISKTNIRTKLDLIQSYIDQIRDSSKEKLLEPLQRIADIMRMPPVEDINPFASPAPISSQTLRLTDTPALNPTSPVDSSVDGTPGEALTDDRITKQRRNRLTSLTPFTKRRLSHSNSPQPQDRSRPTNEVIVTAPSQNDPYALSLLRQHVSAEGESLVVSASSSLEAQEPPSGNIHHNDPHTASILEDSRRIDTRPLVHFSKEYDASNSNDTIDVVDSEMTDPTTSGHSSKEEDITNSNDTVDATEKSRSSDIEAYQTQERETTNACLVVPETTEPLLTSTQIQSQSQSQEQTPKHPGKQLTDSLESQDRLEQVPRSQSDQLTSSAEFPQSHQPQQVIFSSSNSEVNETTDFSILGAQEHTTEDASNEKSANSSQKMPESPTELVVASNSTGSRIEESDLSEIIRDPVEKDDSSCKVNERSDISLPVSESDSIIEKIQSLSQLDGKLEYIQKQFQTHIDVLNGNNADLKDKLQAFQETVTYDRENAIYNLNQLKIDMTYATSQLNSVINQRCEQINQELNDRQGEATRNLLKLGSDVRDAITTYGSFFDRKIQVISENAKKIFKRLEHVTSLEVDNAKYKHAFAKILNELKELSNRGNQANILETKVTMIENKMKSLETSVRKLIEEDKRAASGSSISSLKNDSSRTAIENRLSLFEERIRASKTPEDQSRPSTPVRDPIQDERVTAIEKGLATTRSNVKTLAVQMNKLREDGIKYRKATNTNADIALIRVEELREDIFRFTSSFDIKKVTTRLEKQNEQFLEFEYEHTKLVDENRELKENVKELKETNTKTTAEVNQLQAFLRKMSRQMNNQEELMKIQSQKIMHLESEIRSGWQRGTTQLQRVPPRSTATTETPPMDLTLVHHFSHQSSPRKRPAMPLPEIAAQKIPKLFRSNNEESQ